MPDEMDDYAKALDGLNVDDLGLEDKFNDRPAYRQGYIGQIRIPDINPDLEDQRLDFVIYTVHRIMTKYLDQDTQPFNFRAEERNPSRFFTFKFDIEADDNGIVPHLKEDGQATMWQQYWQYREGKMTLSIDTDYVE